MNSDSNASTFIFSEMLDDDELFRELISIYLETIDNELSAIKLAVDTQDKSLLHNHLHSLKNSSGIFGPELKLFLLCKEHEYRILKEGFYPKLQSEIPLIIEESLRLKEHFINVCLPKLSN